MADGVALPELRSWCAVNLADFVPVAVSPLAGGNSNITVLLTSADGDQLVLRRPPLHGMLATAHDMGREYRMLRALAGTRTPVPTPIACCDDPGVIGAPFFVMAYVPGVVLHDVASAQAFPMAHRHAASLSFIDALAALHAADADAIGLGDLARRDGYVSRQLKRWYRQYDQIRAGNDDTIDRAHDLLAKRIPDQCGVAVVHGDFRLANCILAGDGEVRAVVDWEIATIGDPLADLGYVLATWPHSQAEAAAFPDSPSLVDGFAPRDVLLERYRAQSARDPDHLDFYVAFAFLRAACITYGVAARASRGAQGVGKDAAQFGRQAVACARAALERAEAL